MQEKQILTVLYQMGFFISSPSNPTEAFWSCFQQALKDNKKIRDGKCQILSIIANDFTYKELEHNLRVRNDFIISMNIIIGIAELINKFTISQVGPHTILESKKHARLNGFGAPPLEKPKFHHLKFKMEQIDQFDSFFMRKDIVNMSSYRTHSKSGLPIMYLQDNKQALWAKFSEKYPNGMHCTVFMTRLQGSRFVYQDNLGGLCSQCNECRYEIFASINTIITAHINDEFLKVCILYKSLIFKNLLMLSN
jgi:hypothetical protein